MVNFGIRGRTDFDRHPWPGLTINGIALHSATAVLTLPTFATIIVIYRWKRTHLKNIMGVGAAEIYEHLYYENW